MNCAPWPLENQGAILLMSESLNASINVHSLFPFHPERLGTLNSNPLVSPMQPTPVILLPTQNCRSLQNIVITRGRHNATEL